MKKTSVLAFVLSQLLFIITLPFVYKLTQYLNTIALFVFWACLTLLVYLSVHLIKKEPIVIKPLYWKTGYLLYSACLLFLLFDRHEQMGLRSYNLVPFKTIMFYFTNGLTPLVSFYNLVANIGLFIPYGYLLMILIKKRRVWSLTLIPISSISLIELLQFVTRRGSLDIDDLILNVLGFGIGYLLYNPLSYYLVLKRHNNLKIRE